MTDPTLEGVQVPLVWGAVSDLPVLAANQFALQLTGTAHEEILLTAGHAVPPIFVGGASEQHEQMSRIERVVVQPIVRLSISRATLVELETALRNALSRLDALQELAE